jgi:hypothetical protein
MTMVPECFVRNDQEIAADVVDGEAVIINLGNGNYYSLDEVGTVVWEAIGTPRTLDGIAREIAARYEVTEARARADAGTFLVELLREQLAIQAPGDSAQAGDPGPATADRAAYVPPRMNKYTDMADMLALDPPLPGALDLPWKAPAGE